MLFTLWGWGSDFNDKNSQLCHYFVNNVMIRFLEVCLMDGVGMMVPFGINLKERPAQNSKDIISFHNRKVLCTSLYTLYSIPHRSDQKTEKFINIVMTSSQVFKLHLFKTLPGTDPMLTHMSVCTIDVPGIVISG